MKHNHFYSIRWAAVIALASLVVACGGTPLEPVIPDASDKDLGPDVGVDATIPPPPDVAPPPPDVAPPPLDAAPPPDRVAPPPPDVAPPPPDGATSFCERTLCPSGERCCETIRRCQPAGVLCPIEPPPPIDAGVDGGSSACRSSADCSSASFCAGLGCGTAGLCAPRPRACTSVFMPVCGCDGVTYSNDCVANAAGQRVASSGACVTRDAGVDASPDVSGSFCARVFCGPMTPRCCEVLRRCLSATEVCPSDPPTGCAVNADCPSAQYCAASGCGTRGTCTTRPSACPDLFAPVCGCDGRTYGNSCEAASAGMRVASTGACASTGGCASVADCARGQECVFASTGCATRGVCMGAIACLRPETFCSCAGDTYMSCRPERSTRATGACEPTTSYCAMVRCAPGFTCCEATRACIALGTACSVDGTCTGDAQCGGTGYACCGATGRCYDTRCLSCCMPSAGTCRSNRDCTSAQYCAGTGCGTAGTCATRPSICSTLFAPVCGCDMRTYGNACSASAAGVRVASTGACL